MTETEICNLALARIGAARISGNYSTNPGDQTYASVRACQDCYALTRDRVLRSHPWNFAMNRETLDEPAAEAPAFKWTNAFALPADCLRVVTVNDTSDTDPRKDWTVEGGLILTNDATADVVFVKRTTDTELFDPLFTQCLVVLLAAELSTVLTSGESYREGLLKEYEGLTAPLARRVDANEQRLTEREPYFDSDLVKARFGF